MPSGFLETDFPDDEFRDLVGKLNALSPSALPWQATKAQEEHVDLLGETVSESELYFKRGVGIGCGDDIKLSRLSMERLLYALFTANSSLKFLAEEIHEGRQEELQDATRRHSLLATLHWEEDEWEAG